jgi:predicted PurR-regulated permease PerM
MIRSFLLGILLAAIFSALAAPLYQRIERLVRGRRRLASVLTLLVLVVVVIAPLLAILGIVATQAFHVADAARPWVESQLAHPGRLFDRLHGLPGADRLEPYRAEVLTKASEAVGKMGGFLVGSLSALTRGTIAFSLQLGFVLYTMFFFLVDGREILARIRSFLPLDDTHAQRLLDRFVSVTRATLKGTILIGLAQGTLAGVGFAVAGIDGAVFWGTVMTFLSVLPGIGTAIIWLPASAVLLAGGRVWAAVLLGVWCGAIVGSIDNVMKPRLVGRDTKMHPLFIFLGTLGGISLFGVVGFLLGPIVAALFVTVWEIWGERATGDTTP